MIWRYDMENILDYIVDNEIKPSLIEKLKNCKEPIVIYGAGDVAQYIIKYLKKNNIKVCAICVDKEYLKDNFLGGIPIYSIENIFDRFKLVNVIIGQANYLYAREKIKNHNKIKNIFYMTSTSYYQWNTIQIEFIKNNIEKYNVAYNSLEDDYSKKCMAAYLNARINDDAEYIFPYAQYLNTYFENDVFEINNNEFYLDVGAYIGRAIDAFINKNNGYYKKIVALEPCKESFKIIEQHVKDDKIKKIDLYNIATWRENAKIYLSENESEGTEITDVKMYQNSTMVQAISLDNLWIENKYDDLSIMKINYCYGVKECLLGAEKIIKNYRPKIAIRVGFEELNVAEITNLLKSFIPDYKIYLRYCLQCPAGLLLLAK